MATKPNLYGGDGSTSDDADRDALAAMAPKSNKKKPGAPAQEQIDPVAALYGREIERYHRAVGNWHEEGEQIETVYLDESRNTNNDLRKYAMLWANVEVLKPAVYSKIPTVMASRRYKDRDTVGRISAELIERAVNTSLELNNADESFKMMRDDRLISGRGQVWVRYEATIEQYQIEAEADTIDNETGEPVEAEMAERLVDERVCVDYVHWKDFGHNICRTWNDVWLVWRISYKTKEEVTDRFGAVAAEKLSYVQRSPGYGAGASSDDPENRAKIYELWDKKRRQVAWMAEGMKTFLEVGDPPIDFRDFFPCPEPCYATKSSKQLIPTPDYRYYRDQAKEINDLTDKIGRLTEWLQVKGFVPGAPSGIADPIEEAIRDKGNKELFQQVDSWTQWTESGGTNKLIDWLPIDKVVQALQAAVTARNQLIQDVFQITGISDILRGQTDPNETLGAQELKAQTGTKRLKNTKDEVARVCRDTARLMAEVIAEKFEPESIAAITGFRYMPPPPPMPIMLNGMPGAGPALPGASPPMMPQGMPTLPTAIPQGPINPLMAVMQGLARQQQMPPQNMDDPELTFDDRHIKLLRDNKLRDFRIDVETDSTVAVDENAEKMSRMEFLNAVGPYMAQVVEVAGKAPQLAPVMAEMLMFAVRGFRAARNIEDVIERGFEQAAKMAEQRAMNPQPDPRTAALDAKNANERQRIQNDAQADQASVALEANKQRQDAALEIRKQNLDHAAEIRHQNIDATAQARDHAAKLLGDLQPTGRPQ